MSAESRHVKGWFHKRPFISKNCFGQGHHQLHVYSLHRPITDTHRPLIAYTAGKYFCYLEFVCNRYLAIVAQSPLVRISKHVWADQIFISFKHLTSYVKLTINFFHKICVDRIEINVYNYFAYIKEYM